MRARSFLFILLAALVLVAAHTAFAQTIDTTAVQSQIDTINSQKAQLDAQIAQYQKQLDALGSQHQTLQSNINTLTVSQKQLMAKIASTQKSIDAANLQLAKLSQEIHQAQTSITLNQQAVAASIRTIAVTDNVPVIAQVLSSGTLTDAWSAIDTERQLSAALQGRTNQLAQAKQALSTTEAAVGHQQQQLVSLGSNLTSQNKQLTVTKSTQQQLLAQTKNQESAYQQLIATKKAQQKQFEQALQNLQAQLKPVSAGAVPHPGSGILSWPVSASFEASCAGKAGALGNPFCVTQFFGNTPFATANAQIYNGMGHDGIDIGMPVGTSVRAALAGVVLGTGNTDQYRDSRGAQCYSFGKWVMVKHANGLATLYAHLSSIEVSSGQSVDTGQEVGLSGMTGYATGPHLHFGVYASAGVQIMDLGKFRGSGGTPCTDAGAILPVAPNNAYLNPMSYL